MKSVRATTCAMFSLLIAAGCEQTSAQAPVKETRSAVVNAKQSDSSKQPKLQTLNGTLRYYQMEGGFYGFETDKGKKYTFSGLPSDLRKNNTRLQVSGYVLTDVFTTTQFGDVFKVVDAVKTGDAPPNPDDL